MSELNKKLYEAIKKEAVAVESIGKTLKVANIGQSADACEKIVQEHAKQFAEWCENNYTRVHSKDGGSAWVDHNKHEILVHGSDFHYAKLIKQFGLTTKELYQLFTEQLTNPSI